MSRAARARDRAGAELAVTARAGTAGEVDDAAGGGNQLRVAAGAVGGELPSAGFVVNGAPPAKDSALASAGTELRLANGVSLLGKFDGEFAGHSSTYAGTGTVRYAW
jgi:hypothetical protein